MFETTNQTYMLETQCHKPTMTGDPEWFMKISFTKWVIMTQWHYYLPKSFNVGKTMS